jgi:hypothetical protein
MSNSNSISVSDDAGSGSSNGSGNESNWSKRQRELPIVVMVDPYSTACVVAQELQKRGYLIVALWTIGFAEEMKTHIPKSCGKMEYFGQIDQQPNSHSDTLSELLQVADGRTIYGCVAGGEAGVDYADVFSEYLEKERIKSGTSNDKILSNGTSIPNRRDKYIQQELCKQAGLRSVRQGKIFVIVVVVIIKIILITLEILNN